MTRHRGVALAAALIVVSLLPTPATGGDREAGLRALAGVWQLDQRISDDPHRRLREERGRRPPRRGDKGPPDFGPRIELVTKGSNVLTIAYTDGTLAITDWNDDVLELEVDGKKRSATRQGMPVELEAGWKSSDRLVVRTTGVPGGWIRETYELGQRGAKLFVTVELQRRGSKYPFVFERLYNRTSGL